MNSQTQALHTKRNTIAGVAGNVLEWYDFAVFGYYAPIIGTLFSLRKADTRRLSRPLASLPPVI